MPAAIFTCVKNTRAYATPRECARARLREHGRVIGSMFVVATPATPRVRRRRHYATTTMPSRHHTHYLPASCTYTVHSCLYATLPVRHGAAEAVTR